MLSIGELARLGQVSPRTLRHYDDLGVLVPAQVDPTTGYRSYEVGQLADLRRVLALRGLGVPLGEIAALLSDALSVEQLRGMLRLREVEIAAELAEHKDRLRRVAAHLDALERGEIMRSLDVVVKRTDPVRAVLVDRWAPGYGNANIGPVLDEHLPLLWARLVDAGIEPGRALAYYEWPDDDGRVHVHVGFEIGDQPFDPGDDGRVPELPVEEVASTLHRGSPVDISDTFVALVRWIEANGYAIAGRSRELTLEWDLDDPAKCVIEIQLPVERV
jgi:DNA-binding transcriptional MerR regulator/effector-binding domain-containing protein